MSELGAIVQMLRKTLARSVEVERRLGGMEFRGVVKMVDGARHAVKMVIGQTPEGEDVLSPWVAVAQTAGAMKFHDLPSVGQQGVLRSANGDIEQASFSALHWSDENPAISDDPAEKIMTFGAVRVHWNDDSVTINVGDTSISLTPDGVTLNGASVAVVGDVHTHNGTDIGDTHVHGGVITGGADTDTPH